MRPFRLLLFLAFCLFAVTTLLFLNSGHKERVTYNSAHQDKKKSRLRAFFSFNTPLFPPSAIISLTDDNSTFFLARPAAFGPLLPRRGQSGQLWIGSGFGEEHVDRVGVDSWPEGELGCSDVPGWDASLGRVENVMPDGNLMQKFTITGKVADTESHGKAGLLRRGESKPDIETNREAQIKPTGDDGTDDYLHTKEPEASNAANDDSIPTVNRHADIQSLQESAEISGKIVLLSRGGCGFLEKVKWAQRRGGIALIVGDDIPGGPLVTMYAKGDTSNVTIPAMFTSHTTAHLLSSLMPSGSLLGGISPKTGGRLGHGMGGSVSKDEKKMSTKPTKNEPPQAETDSSFEKPKSSINAGIKTSPKTESKSPGKSRGGFLQFLLSFLGLGGNDGSPNIRRPSSGDHDWIMVEDWQDDKPEKPTKKLDLPVTSGETETTTEDFVIGVHDWRDPDLIKKPSNSLSKPQNVKHPAGKRAASKEKDMMKGGSITPGSGEYERPGSSSDTSSATSKGISHSSESDPDSHKNGWLPHLGWTGNAESASEDQSRNKQESASDSQRSKQDVKHHPNSQDTTPHREGLWVTLTPTNMSSSPFFDTILVLVVSPLVTLTVVYALLLLRSRIRRRRWRAPKSVVDRLPVRTYHTMSTESSTSALASPISTSPTTPLLQSTASSRRVLSRSHSRSRPRSRTTSEVPGQAASSSSALLDDLDFISLTESEKREKGLAEWRRRYGGRQKECVVCLEEYIDGVSRVMSLPCGHEFHVECM